MAEKGVDAYGNKLPEEKLTSGQSFQRFLWNPSTKELLGRTGGSWAKILIFYVIFYACLAAFWTVMLLIFYQTIDPHYPKWQLGESRIGTNPGLGFRPRPPEERVESTLIWFSGTANDGTWKGYKEDLDKFLEPYAKDSTQGSIGKGEHVDSPTNCQPNKEPSKGKFCPFNAKDLFSGGEKCSASNNYGFGEGQPCILVKLNKIYGWKPEPYTNNPEDMKMLTDAKAPSQVIETVQAGMGGVVINCEGENAADKENIGMLRYAPGNTKSGVIPSQFYPYTNQPGYQSPFVFVHFMGAARGILINVECKAWAKNIRHERQDREGSVHFELLID